MSYRRKHKLLSLILSFLLVIIVGTQSGWLARGAKTVDISQPGLYGVHRFIDGDTISVDMNGSIETIRMIGVDTPETHKPNTPVQCYGELAAAYTKQLIGTSKVRLQADALDTNRDRYGRLLRYVYLPDGRLIEQELIKGGYGFAYTLFPFSKTEQFQADMRLAQEAKAGLWSACAVSEDQGAFHTGPAN